MKKYIVLLILCFSHNAFATGPSRATLNIVPLSINENGSLFYKYMYISNPMGSHDIEPIFYGVGFFKDRKFTNLQEQVLIYNNYSEEKYNNELAKLTIWLNSSCKINDLKEGFTSCNLKEYVVNRLMNAAEIKQQYGIDITKATSYFLNPGELDVSEDESIYISYAFKGAIIAEFNQLRECIEGEDYVNVLITPLSYDEFNDAGGKFSGYFYECVNATGIIMNN
ncbi:hypothetical protein RHO14_04225 [Orbus wheelerorum]|uniref:hypothetical protein n=1 Tax=Orbus wheelerorum TaxID=3074111 RepID=UPI00370D8930